MYYEVFDQVTSSSIDRFETDSARFYQSSETLATEQCQSEDAEKIINFHQGDFDNDKLLQTYDKKKLKGDAPSATYYIPAPTTFTPHPE